MNRSGGEVKSQQKVCPEKMRILVRRVDHMTPLMSTVAKVLEAVNRSCSPKELTAIVSTSPELSMKVVRVANSAAFGSRKAESVRQAVEFLGWQRVASIVMTVGMREESEVVLEDTKWDPANYQKRSVALAFVSQLLAKRVEPWNEEKYYMSGLFQEWGYLVLAQYAAVQLAPISSVLSRTAVESPIEVEQFYIDTDHCELGAIAAEEYGLAPEIVASIRHHHEPANAEQEFQSAADVAHVASWVVGELGIQIFEGASNHTLDKFALLRLGWSQNDVEAIRNTILGAISTVSTALDAAA